MLADSIPRETLRVSEETSTIESGAADRLIFFSDAVVAIAITLLALELPVPEGNTVHEFWASAHKNDDHYTSFLISFVVISLAWSAHHHAFRYVERSDSRLRTLNMAWLLMIVLNPFATRMLTSGGHSDLHTNALRFGFYALLQVLSNAAFLAMIHHMISHRLQAADTPPMLVREADWQVYGLTLGFGLSIPVFFLTTRGWILWIVIPVAVGQLHRYRRRRAVNDAAAAETRQSAD